MTKKKEEGTSKCPVYEHHELVEIARGLVSDKYLVPDLEKHPHEWGSSLALMSDVILDHREDIGSILVPIEPHLAGRWINGIAPGVTISVKLVNKEQTAEIERLMEPMIAILYPEDQKEAAE